jgi:hypothetical protein
VQGGSIEEVRGQKLARGSVTESHARLGRAHGLVSPALEL